MDPSYKSTSGGDPSIHLLLTFSPSSTDMEALWILENRWKLLSTQEAVLLFVFAAFSVIGLCTALTLTQKKRARRRQGVGGGEDVHEVQYGIISNNNSSSKWGDGTGCGWGSIKRLLMESVRWSGASRWEERLLQAEAEAEAEAVPRFDGVGDVGWQLQSHNSVSPVWQRPILMGEKCELPRFSGLILYDETGHPLIHKPHQKQTVVLHQEKTTVARVTLRDLL